MIIPHGHGGGKAENIFYLKPFIEQCLEGGFLVACPDERGSGDRREFVEQGDTQELKRANYSFTDSSIVRTYCERRLQNQLSLLIYMRKEENGSLYRKKAPR